MLYLDILPSELVDYIYTIACKETFSLILQDIQNQETCEDIFANLFYNSPMTNWECQQYYSFKRYLANGEDPFNMTNNKYIRLNMNRLVENEENVF